MIDYEYILKTRKRINARYIFIYCPEHKKANMQGNVRLHILVAEQKLGRELTGDECVHHLDLNKHNNEPSNLIVFKTNADHGRFHATGIKIEIEPNVYISPIQYKKCPVCGKNFYSHELDAIYCSQECSHISQRKSNRPSKEELFKLIKTTSFVQIGNMFNVSDNAIRKWCKVYGLPYKQKDIKNFMDTNQI